MQYWRRLSSANVLHTLAGVILWDENKKLFSVYGMVTLVKVVYFFSFFIIIGLHFENSNINVDIIIQRSIKSIFALGRMVQFPPSIMLAVVL